MDYNKIIKEIGRGKHHARDLDRETAYTLYRGMLAGDVPELGALLIAMRIKAEAPRGVARFLSGDAGAGDGATGPRIAAAPYRHSQLQRRA